MHIDNINLATGLLFVQPQATPTPIHTAQNSTAQKSILKTANDLPKAVLELIPPVPENTASGNLGKNINISA